MGFAVIAPELLGIIFGLLFFESFKESELERHSFHAPHLLVPVLRVCQSWHAAAERALYTAIYLGYGDNDERALEKLCEVLEKNLHLSLMVREIHLTTRMTKVEARNQIKLIRLCPKVQTLQLAGWHECLLTEYHDAIKGLRLLRHLNLSRKTFWNTCDPFCSFDTLLALVQHLPRIETVLFDDRATLDSDGLAWEPGKEEEQPVNTYSWDNQVTDDQYRKQRIQFMEKKSEQRLQDISLRFALLYPRVNACPELRVFQWRSAWNYMHFRSLSLIAPNLEAIPSIYFTLEEAREDAQQALEKWSSSLRHLILYPTTKGDDDGVLITDALASNMTSLRKLAVNVNAFASKAYPGYGLQSLSKFPVLEALTFLAGADEHILALKVAISESMLPALKQVVLLYTHATAHGVVERLKVCCEKHSVVLIDRGRRGRFDVERVRMQQ